MTVADDGIGITPEMLPRTFELFVRDARAAVVNRSGLGIGLAVVRELVAAHGGTVAASSGGTGSGSSFVVALPLLGDAINSSARFRSPVPVGQRLAGG